MPSPSRQKGNRHEREVVEKFKAFGLEARRVTCSGSNKLDPDDVIVCVPTLGERRIECKHHKSGFRRLYKWLEPCWAVIHRADRSENLVTLRLGDLLGLLTCARASDDAQCSMIQELQSWQRRALPYLDEHPGDFPDNLSGHSREAELDQLIEQARASAPSESSRG